MAKTQVTRYGQYTVPPFANYTHTDRHCYRDGTMPCAICERPVVIETARHWAVIVDGGLAWGTEESPEDNGHMGAFPIGTDCHKRYVRSAT